MWSDIWNVSYIELRVWNQASHDHRSFERNLSNCEQKPEKVRTSTGFEPVEVLTFSGFCSQLLKLRSKLRWSWLAWIHHCYLDNLPNNRMDSSTYQELNPIHHTFPIGLVLVWGMVAVLFFTNSLWQRANAWNVTFPKITFPNYNSFDNTKI